VIFAVPISKVGVTDVLMVKGRVHAPVPVQGPDHPAKDVPELGVAVSVTDVPLGKLAAQVVPQLIPVGLLTTVPMPVPALTTES